MVRKSTRWMASALSLWLASSASMAADLIELHGRLLDSRQQPLAGQAIRVLLKGEGDIEAADTGVRLVTDAEGYFQRSVEVPVEGRFIQGSLLYVPVPLRSQYIGIAIEGQRFQRQVLDWLHLDWLKSNFATQLDTVAQSASGRFDMPLQYDEKRHAFFFADQPNLLVTDPGARLYLDEVEAPEQLADGRRHWRIRFTLLRD